jgi:hypothetical protein
MTCARGMRGEIGKRLSQPLSLVEHGHQDRDSHGPDGNTGLHGRRKPAMLRSP